MTYSIDDGNGNQITTGLQEHEAHASAQRMADERGEPVYLYSTADGVQSRYETIEPTEGDDGDVEETKPESARAESARTEFAEFSHSVGSDPHAEEQAILADDRSILPPCVIAVLDGGEKTEDYWMALQSETARAQAEHDAEIAAGHEWHQDPRETQLDALRSRAINDVTRAIMADGITLTFGDVDDLGDETMAWIKTRLGLSVTTTDRGVECRVEAVAC